MPRAKIVVLGGAFSGPAAAARARETDQSAKMTALVFRSETGRRGYLAARIADASGIACGCLSGGTR